MPGLLNVTLVGDRELVLRLRAIPSKMRASLSRAVTTMAVLAEARVKEKLSGEVLNVRTGALRRSITYEVLQGAASVTGRVFSSGDVRYAAIHEFGGTIHIPEIVPVNAHALHFFIGGNEVFAMRVAAHDVNMPERSYMRSTLEEMQGRIRSSLIDAARAGLLP